MKSWYHVDCFFELKKAKNSVTMKNSGDVNGWDQLLSEDKRMIINKIGPEFKETSADDKEITSTTGFSEDKFSVFQDIVKSIANVTSYTAKSQILQKFFKMVRFFL